MNYILIGTINSARLQYDKHEFLIFFSPTFRVKVGCTRAMQWLDINPSSTFKSINSFALI